MDVHHYSTCASNVLQVGNNLRIEANTLASFELSLASRDRITTCCVTMIRQGVSGVINLRPTFSGRSVITFAHKIKCGGQSDGTQLYHRRLHRLKSTNSCGDSDYTYVFGREIIFSSHMPWLLSYTRTLSALCRRSAKWRDRGTLPATALIWPPFVGRRRHLQSRLRQRSAAKWVCAASRRCKSRRRNPRPAHPRARQVRPPNWPFFGCLHRYNGSYPGTASEDP